ncbi:hypothetical protein C4546_00400 [Candidatus Parcubacteria bacterium]|jgi:septal ring factor EnvC (AmiA/AmiB activator)|nr:MAG: hypothetical protein C4546_00400 [Candidatus Parcubacteria bacterium]
MSELNSNYLDEKLRLTQTAILEAVNQGFSEQYQRISKIEEDLSALTTSVDRFAKIFTDLNQEVIVLRQQLRDAEIKLEKLVPQNKAA